MAPSIHRSHKTNTNSMSLKQSLNNDFSRDTFNKETQSQLPQNLMHGHGGYKGRCSRGHGGHTKPATHSSAGAMADEAGELATRCDAEWWGLAAALALHAAALPLPSQQQPYLRCLPSFLPPTHPPTHPACERGRERVRDHTSNFHEFFCWFPPHLHIIPFLTRCLRTCFLRCFPSAPISVPPYHQRTSLRALAGCLALSFLSFSHPLGLEVTTHSWLLVCEIRIVVFAVVGWVG